MPHQIHTVVVDRKILDGFKRRAMKHYPKEYAEQLWGAIKRRRAHIYVIEPFDLDSQTKGSVDFDFDQQCGTEHGEFMLLGSIHTHPAPYDGTEPSDADIVEAEREKEIVWGIMAIRKTAKRHFFGCRFWSNSGGEIELLFSEKKS